jgi:hypothetical protein
VLGKAPSFPHSFTKRTSGQANVSRWAQRAHGYSITWDPRNGKRKTTASASVASFFDENDIFGDGVLPALRASQNPAASAFSDDAQRQIRGKVDFAMDALSFVSVLARSGGIFTQGHMPRGHRLGIGAQNSKNITEIACSIQRPTPKADPAPAGAT